MLKNRKLYFMLFAFICFIAMGVCVIVDIAITHQITWSAYPLLSIPFGWLILSSLFIKKRGIILCTCTLTLLILPYLYFIEKITPVSGWFFPLGLPCAISGLIFCWVVYFLFHFIKINIWYKSAISVFLAGAILSPVINHFADTFTETEPSFLNYFINIFSCVAVSAFFGILGYIKSKSGRMVDKQ